MRFRDNAQGTMALVPPGMRDWDLWVEIGCADKLRKRLIVKCRRCGRAATFSLDALASGTAACECSPPTSEQQQRFRDEIEQRKRQREQRNWKPGDRS